MPAAHLHPRPLFQGIFAASCLLAALSARADTIDWSAVNYSPTPAQSLTSTPVSTVNGTTASVQFSNDGYFYTGVQSPDAGTYASSTGTNMNAIYANGGTTGAYGLQIAVDFGDTNKDFIAGAAVPVTITFSRPVMNVSFSFYDVDAGTVSGGPYTDQLTNIVATGTGGGTVVPTTLTPGADNVVSGNGFIGNASNAQNAAGGNAAVSFGSTAITQFTFTYTDTATAGSTHSQVQIIALSNISYDNVPEPSARVLVLGAGALALALFRARGALVS